jgi:hypothetical protein
MPVFDVLGELHVEAGDMAGEDGGAGAEADA